MSDEKFNPNEPGLSHPFTRCTVSLTDDGRLILMAGDKCGMIFDEETGVISIFGTEIRFTTEEMKLNGRTMKTAVLPSGSAVSTGTQIRRIESAKE